MIRLGRCYGEMMVLATSVEGLSGRRSTVSGKDKRAVSYD